MTVENKSFSRLTDRWRICQNCRIGRWAFKHVFGRGSLPADIVFVGEGPGVSEDVIGSPFVGESGQLLDLAIARTKLEGRYFITNLVACRPCDKEGGPNRAPTDREVENCSDRLQETIRIVNPKVVICLGKVPEKHLAEVKWLKRYRTYFMYHPAYILRQGGAKSPLFRQFVNQLRRAFRNAKDI